MRPTISFKHQEDDKTMVRILRSLTGRYVTLTHKSKTLTGRLLQAGWQDAGYMLPTIAFQPVDAELNASGDPRYFPLDTLSNIQVG